MMNVKFTKAKVRTLLLVLFLTFGQFYSQVNNGSVGINTSTPNTNSVLDVVSGSNNKGILIPRLTETQRNAISIHPATDDGLTIFNVTEDCYNYWSLADNEWKSVCGQIGKSVFTIDCSNTKAMGTYIQGKELTASNYLSVTVNVTKIGNYTITGTTTNGYNFYGTGVFLNTGTQTVQVLGQGTPTAIQLDTVQLKANGVDVTCTPSVKVDVLSAAGTYTMSCGKAIVNGVYKVGVSLTSSNTITLPVNVTSLGSYSITTNTVEGISFKGSGTFTATGSQDITLNGTGTPTSTSAKTLTITSNSQGGVSTTCTVTVIVVIPVKTVLHYGASNAYGYIAYKTTSGPDPSNRASANMIGATTNFGTLATSTVKYEGFFNPQTKHVQLDGGASTAALTAALNNKPDIVIIGYNASISAADAAVLTDYLNKKGVIIASADAAAAGVTSAQSLMRAVFADQSINAAGVNGGGAVYPMASINDEIMNGPFGDVRGKNWGEDASASISLTGLPSGTVTTYSNATSIGGTTYSGVTMFKHNTLNLFYVGDGGWLSNELTSGQYPSTTIEPFATTSSYVPTTRTGYGTGGAYSVENARVFGNVMAWAIKQAEFNGINTP